MALDVSSWFVLMTQQPAPVVLRRFTIGSSDYTDRVVKYPAFKRTANEIRSTSINLPLANADGALNHFFKQTYTIPNTCTLEMGITLDAAMIGADTGFLALADKTGEFTPGEILFGTIGGGGGGNDFSNDPNCVAVWRFEDTPGFTADSIGGNTLTNSGADEENSIVYEGAQSAKFIRTNSDYMSIVDGDLDAGFPKGDSNLSICFRLYIPTLESNRTYPLIIKAAISSPKEISYGLYTGYWDDWELVFFSGYNSGSTFEQAGFNGAFQAGRWYSCAVTYNSTTYAHRMRIYDHTADALLGSDVTGNFANPMAVRNVPFSLSRWYFNSLLYSSIILDEVVVFNRVLSVEEIDAVRAGTFGAASAAAGTIEHDAGEIVYLSGLTSGTFVNSMSLIESGTASAATAVGDVAATADEYAKIFTGFLKDVHYSQKQCTLRIKDRLWDFAERKVGDPDAHVDIGSSIPSEIAWTLCTCYGGLSSVRSASNPDIDYPSFLTWAAQFSQDNILMSANYQGMTVAEAVGRLGKMTDSAVWVEGDGKLAFKKFIEPSSLDITFTRDEFKDILIDVESLRVINRHYTNFDYSVGSEYWQKTVFTQNSVSVNSFGLYEDAAKDETVWYVDSVGAMGLSQRKVNLLSNPPARFGLTSGLYGIHKQIGETVRLVDSFYDLTSGSGWRMVESRFDMDRAGLKLTLDEATVMNGFYLDVSDLDGDDLLL
jgi:hypothetical protein